IAFTTALDQQLVSITSVAGPITVDADLGNTDDDLALIALAGDIEGGAGTLFARDLRLEAAAGGIGLVAAVDVNITGCATLITGGAGSAGDINITSDAPLAICEITTDPATQQTVTLTTSGASDLVIESPIVSSDNLVLTADGNIDVDASVSAHNLTLQAGGTVDVAAGARLIAGGDGTALTIIAAAVFLNAGASPADATVTNSGTGTVSITATSGDITLANNAIRVGEGLLTLSADGNSILSTTDAGTEISADGDVTLVASSIGPANGGVDFTGDGSGNSTLMVTATAGGGSIQLDWLTDQLSAIELFLDDADTDVLLTLPAGDHVEVRGAATTGLPGTSTVHSADTTSLAATLHVELREDGADLLLHTGTVFAGADVCFVSEDDLIVGDAAGTAVVAGPGVNVTLIADSDGDGFGAIIDGGGTITMDGGALRMTAGSGIGAAGSPIRTINLGDVAAYTATGGIFILNSGSGEINVTSVTSCGDTTTGLTANDGDVELVNSAGGIGLSEAVAAPGGTVTLDASTSITDNHAAGTDVIAQTLVLSSGTGVASAADPLETSVAVLSFTNGTGGVHIVNDSSAATPAGSLTLSGTSTGTGLIEITETGGDLLIGPADLVTHSGPVRLAATLADAAIVLAAGSDIVTTGGGTPGADVTLIADNMDLSGSIIAGVGTVTLETNDPAQAIEVGGGATDGPGSLGLSEAELSNIVTSGGLTIGSQTNTGALMVVGALDLAAAGNLTGGLLALLSGAGGIQINDLILSLVDFAAATLNGDISFGPAGVVDAGANIVSLAASGGAIHGNAAALTNVIARGLAAAASNGIGSSNALQTDVGTLAALNTTSGNIDIFNDSGGAALVIGTVGPLSGVVNQAPAATGGDITITNTGPLLVNADVLATGGGDITLTADVGGGPIAIPTNVQISARVHATGGNGNVTLNSAVGLTVLNDAVAGPEVRVTGMGEVLGSFGVIFNGGATISTATGDVGSPQATLRNVVASPVDILGFTSVSGGFGDPGDFNFTITADFSVIPVQTAGFGSPGSFLFTQLLLKSPNANPADPITITVTLVRNARVRIVENTAVVVVQAPVPGEGFGATFFEFEADTPPLPVDVQRTSEVSLTSDTTTPVLVQTQTFATAVIDQQGNLDERVLILWVLRRDGSVKDELFFRGQEADAILDDLQGFLARLPDGRYRLLLKEPGPQRLRLVRDLTLEGGVPRSDIAHEAGLDETAPVFHDGADSDAGERPRHVQPTSRPGADSPEASAGSDDGMTRLHGDDQGTRLTLAGPALASPPPPPAASQTLLAGVALAAAASSTRFDRIDRLMEILGRGPRRLTARRLIRRAPGGNQ
ncbi:MAG TPA: hypothetical protein VML55_05665, partial [Planctomycetaceae bacterium]|nr:hypothetical protein [Planctomycetaceae bacterium]